MVLVEPRLTGPEFLADLATPRRHIPLFGLQLPHWLEMLELFVPELPMLRRLKQRTFFELVVFVFLFCLIAALPITILLAIPHAFVLFEFCVIVIVVVWSLLYRCQLH